MTGSVMILGASGFLGRHLVAHLQDRMEVVIPERASWDLRDKASLAALLRAHNVDTVINMAALSSTLADQQTLYEVNSYGQLNLLEAMMETGFAGRHVYFSSSNIYGALTDPVIHEETRAQPLNHYSCAKILAENFCSVFADKVDSTIVRPFSVIGAGQKAEFLLPTIARHYAERAPVIELGNTAVARDFLDARDLCAMIGLILNVPETPQVINLCNGRTVSLYRIFQGFTALTGHEIEVKVNPAFIRPRDITYQCGDNARIRALGYASGYDIDETIRWIYEQYAQKVD